MKFLNSNFFLLASLADYLYLHFKICSSSLNCYCDYKQLKTDIGIWREQISQGKRLILFWKVRENEFCRIVGTVSWDQGVHIRWLGLFVDNCRYCFAIFNMFCTFSVTPVLFFAFCIVIFAAYLPVMNILYMPFCIFLLCIF